MPTAEEIAKCYRERIKKCEERQHINQPITRHGNCDHCVRWQVELLVMGFDPQTGQRPEWRQAA